MESNSQTSIYIPQSAYLYFPPESEKKVGEEKKIVRSVFEGDTTYDAFENNAINQLYEELNKQNIVLPKDWKRSETLKFIIACYFDINKAIKSIQEYLTWYNETFPITFDQDILDILNSGIIYAHGRDNRFRPILIFNCYKLDTKTMDIDKLLLAMAYFLDYVMKNLLLPGQVERWIFINDLKGLGITSLPFGVLKRVMGYLQNNFRSRLHKMYIMNSPTTIYFTWKAVKPLLEETTTNKINFSKTSENEDMWRHTNKSQVEERFGGTATNIEKDYWPPKNPSQDYFISGENSNELLITKEEYLKRQSAGKLANYNVSKELTESSVGN